MANAECAFSRNLGNLFCRADFLTNVFAFGLAANQGPDPICPNFAAFSPAKGRHHPPS